MLRANHQRQEIRALLDTARCRVGVFTGLYSDEDLANEVLSACDDALVLTGPSPRLAELRQVVEARCQTLTDVSNRFSVRDPTVIAAARMQVIISLDQFQDAALEHLSAVASQVQPGWLRRRSL